VAAAKKALDAIAGADLNREFGMAAIVNGISLHGGLCSFCATFMVFSDYLRPALRPKVAEHLGFTAKALSELISR
jgi:transketolase